MIASKSQDKIQPVKTKFTAIIPVLLVIASASAAETNLLPNGNFAGKEPLMGWLVDFPDESFYKGNAPYIKVSAAGGRRAVVIDLPPGIAGNQGGKIESVPVPVVPGATYRIEVDCMTWDFSAKIHVEVWSRDPHPEQKRTIFRRAPAGGRPALMMCFRAQVPSPPARSKVWTTTGRDFKIPETVLIAGKKQSPEFISVKVVSYEGTPSAGKSYFSNFRLLRLDDPSADEKPESAP